MSKNSQCVIKEDGVRCTQGSKYRVWPGEKPYQWYYVCGTHLKTAINNPSFVRRFVGKTTGIRVTRI